MHWQKPERETGPGEFVYVEGEGREQFQLRDEGGGSWVYGDWDESSGFTVTLSGLVCYIDGPPPEHCIEGACERCGKPATEDDLIYQSIALCDECSAKHNKHYW